MTDPKHEAAVRAALAELDGSTASAVRLLTGLSGGELDQIGGFRDESAS